MIQDEHLALLDIGIINNAWELLEENLVWPYNLQGCI